LKKNIRILKNVFVNTERNKLKLCNIFFTDKFERIEQIGNKEFDWSEISDKNDRERILFQINNNISGNDTDVIDGADNLAIPGAIDAHVHFNTPGFEDREDFEHGSNAAASGGVTTVIDMPCTSIPPVTSKENFNTKLAALKNRSLIDFKFWGGVSGNLFDDINKIRNNIFDLASMGVAGFKAYLLSGMESFTDLTLEQMKMTAKIINETGLPLAVHAEDKEYVETRMNESIRNKKGWIDYWNSRSVEAEVLAVRNMYEIAKATDCKIHIVHLSSKAALKIVRDAKEEGINLTAETCPHYLHFTKENFEDLKISNFLKTAPPVKNVEDKEALWEGLAEGTIEFVTTDHAGCDPLKEKSSQNFWEVYGGIPGVEHRVPFLFSEGFLKKRLNLEQTIDFLCSNPAQFFNLKGKGNLKIGNDADLALINLWDKIKIDSSKMLSKGKYTPLEGAEFSAKVTATILRGKLIYSNKKNREVAFNYGRLIS